MTDNRTWTLDNVRLYMKAAHEGQYRNDQKTPYCTHPERVLSIAMEVFSSTDPEIVNDIEFQAACLFHDVDEDCSDKGYTNDQIASLYGGNVANYCRWVTKPEMPAEWGVLGHQQRQQYKAIFNMALYRNLARNAPRQSHLIKIADRLANTEEHHLWTPSFRRKYISDTENLVEAFEAIRGVELLKTRLYEIREESQPHREAA